MPKNYDNYRELERAYAQRLGHRSKLRPPSQLPPGRGKNMMTPNVLGFIKNPLDSDRQYVAEISYGTGFATRDQEADYIFGVTVYVPIGGEWTNSFELSTGGFPSVEMVARYLEVLDHRWTGILYDHLGVVKYAWPGGYRVWYVTASGDILCAECVENEFDNCFDPEDSQWYVIANLSEAHLDDDDEMICDHCGSSHREVEVEGLEPDTEGKNA